MNSRRHIARRRSGAAAVECAIIMQFVLCPLMIGLWEMGRVVQVQQIISNGAREGARMAAQGNTINSNGTSTYIYTSVAPPNASQLPNVKAAVMQYLSGAGLSKLTWSDVDVTFAFTSSPTGAISGATDPYQGIKGQQFSVTVTITDKDSSGNFKTTRPLRDKTLWTTLGLVNPTQVTFTSNWQMLVDDTFTVNATLPSW